MVDHTVDALTAAELQLGVVKGEFDATYFSP